MKRLFIYFLLLLNAFFVSYAYGLNSIRVKVVDHSLPPLKPPAVATKAPVKGADAKSSGAKGKADTATGAKGKHQATSQTKKSTTSAAAKKSHAAHKSASENAQ